LSRPVDGPVTQLADHLLSRRVVRRDLADGDAVEDATASHQMATPRHLALVLDMTWLYLVTLSHAIHAIRAAHIANPDRGLQIVLALILGACPLCCQPVTLSRLSAALAGT
jgi:hypothetical protein